MRTEIKPLDVLAYSWGYWFLSLAFLASYLGYHALPGNDLQHPLGWWGWFDQSHYIKSARALAAGNFSEDHHLYPLGFAVLGALFISLTPNHPFFFVSLFSVLGTLFLFIKIAGTFKIGRQWAVVIFIGALLQDKTMFLQFVIPWTTTPIVLYIFTALYVALRPSPPTIPAAVVSAVCFVLVLVTRPGDIIALLPIGLVILVRLVRENDGRRVLVTLALGLAAASVVMALYLTLYFWIYGWKYSFYMTHAGAIGLRLEDYVSKLYAIVIDPRPVYGEGQGLVQRAPWLIWAFPATVLLGLSNWRASLIAAVIVLNIGFYTAFNDFVPHGLWRYLNIHYMKVSYLLLALLGASFAATCFQAPRRLIAMGCLLLPFAVFRLDSVAHSATAVAVPNEKTVTFECAACGNARVAILAPTHLTYAQIYYEANRATIGPRSFRNIYDFRTVPVDGTIRAIFPIALGGRPATIEFVSPHGYSNEKPPQVTLISTELRLRVLN